MVWWDQRGSGLSYHPDVPPQTVNPEQLVADTVALTKVLRERFGQEKIYLWAARAVPLSAFKRLHGPRSNTTPTSP